jgi:hypothetical protein
MNRLIVRRADLELARALTVSPPEGAMRAFTLGLVISMAVLFPKVSNAQAYAFGTPAPEVTAAAADWQARSEPIVVNGLVYFPTRAFRLFDAQVMQQTGVYERVPVYSDVTLEPYSILYVPISRSNMRLYERKRDGDLAGTVGSRTPSFPVEIASDTVRKNAERAAAVAGVAGATGTAGSSVPAPASSVGATFVPTPEPDRLRRVSLQSIPGPAGGTNGVWLEFNGAVWYADGPAVSFTPDRFEPIGEYRGFPVYRDKQNAKSEIWVSVVKDGPVAPYTRR